MKKVLFAFFVLFSIVGCSSSREASTYSRAFMTSTVQVFNREFSPVLLDSIYKADALPTYDTWFKMQSRDFETGRLHYEYLYVRSTNVNQVSYKLEVTPDGNFKIIKRESR